MPLINGFFDTMPLHLLATGTLQHLGSLYREGRFEVERFRPNVLIADAGGESGFVENSWIGKTVAIGNARLKVMAPTIRCVMSTLPQGESAGAIRGILKTAASTITRTLGCA